MHKFMLLFTCCVALYLKLIAKVHVDLQVVSICLLIVVAVSLSRPIRLVISQE